jgi:KaiC/GvpD/RAD55 family RecA-like ATPase
MTDIAQSLRDTGIAFREQSGQLVTSCPFCGRANHLFVNPTTGAWDCKIASCGQSGGFTKLYEALTGSEIREAAGPERKKTDPPTMAYVDGCRHKLLGPNGTEAMEYLKGRRIGVKEIHQFKLGLRVTDRDSWLCIPYFRDGQPVNVKYRRLPPGEKGFERWEGGESILFNQDVLKDVTPDTPVYVTEGEIDCISMWANGFTTCVSTSLGAGSFQPAWVDILERFERVYLVYDSDKEGRAGAQKHSRRFDPARVYDVVLPEKDANEFFCKGHTAEELDYIIQAAKPFDIENIQTLDQIFMEIVGEKERKESRIAPRWPSVGNLTGPYEPGDLIVLTAPPKIGKTTFVLNDAYAWAGMRIPVLFYCLEMRPRRLFRKLLQIAMGLTEAALTPEKVGEGYRKIYGIPLCFGYNYKKCSLDIVVETIKRGVRRFGFEAVIFDNLHFLARSITHQVQELGVISKTFKLLAEELQIPIVLIAQPRRGEDENRVVSINDLKGSSDIGADADQVIVLYRKKRKAKDGLAEVSFEPETLVRVDASRYRSGGETLLYYDGATGRFREIERNRETSGE